MSGTSTSDTSPGTMAAFAHSVQPIPCPIVAAVRLAASGFAAIPVRNMADEITEVWKQVSMSHEPSLRSVPSPVRDPQASQRDLTSGRKMPPARAETEGMAGARSASAKTSA
uniref:POMT1 n=1 Tax=Arundo donax TaxID=35708 RepID=A0A0A9HJH1_ARUDO